MEKIIITPNEVRALGNIVSPKSKNDFIGSKIVQSTATVQGIPSTIYTSTFLPVSQLSVTGEHYVKSDKPLTLEITVTDNNNTPVRSGRVYCTVNNKEYSHSLNSDGTCELKIPSQPDGLHTLKIYYPGTNSLGGSFRNFTVVWGDELVLDLFGTSKLVQPDSYSELFGTLSSGDVGVPGVRVEFFENYVINRINAFASKDLMQTGEDIDISAKVADIDGSGVADQLVDFYEEFDINFNLSASPSLIQTSGYSEVTAQLSDADGSPIRNQEVKFYEVYASRFLRGHVSSDIVQPNGVVEVYGVLSDRDGSRIPDKKIKFYEEFDYSDLHVMSTSQVLQTESTIDLSARLRDDDGSLIRDEKVDFYVIE